MKKKWELVAKAAGIEADKEIQSTSDGVFMSTEQMDSLQATLAANAKAETDAAAALQIANDSVTAAEGALATEKSAHNTTATNLVAAKKSVVDLTAENTTLKATVAGKPATAAATITKTGSESSTTDVDADWETINSLPHNKDLDANN